MKNHITKRSFAVSCVLCLSSFLADQAAATELTSYHIGNSLTWDAQVANFPNLSAEIGLDHEIGHHIRCSKSLPYIYANPTETCVTPTSFGTWSEALPDYAWDVVTLQIHPSDDSNFASDTDAALSLIDLARSNPNNANTRFILYGAWPQTHGDYSAQYNTDIAPIGPTTETSHTDAYQTALYEAVRQARPDAQVELIQTGKMLQLIDEEIKSEVANGSDWFGFTDVDQLYRDTIHLGYTEGRWIASLTMWSAVTGEDAGSLPDVTNPVLNGISQYVSDNFDLVYVPEPSSLILASSALPLLSSRRWRDRSPQVSK